MKFKDTAELRKLVETEDGLLACSMVELREMAGAGRLGVHVKAEISRQLSGAGLGHFPSELPQYQHEEVRVYRLGSPMEDIVKAVLNPSGVGDKKLRQSVNTGAQEILNQVRALVCD